VRPKLIEGELYFIRAYDVGKGGVPLKTSHDYVVQFVKRDDPVSSGWNVLILATSCIGDSYPGIPWGEYDWRSGTFPQISPYHRIFYMGDNRSEDCMDVKKFKPKDAALCIGWPYASKELINRLQTT
jgi:hypothetical protein